MNWGQMAGRNNMSFVMLICLDQSRIIFKAVELTR